MSTSRVEQIPHRWSPRSIQLPRPPFSAVPAGLVIDRLLPGPDRLVLLARPRSPEARRPACARPSARVHSAYLQRLAKMYGRAGLDLLRRRLLAAA